MKKISVILAIIFFYSIFNWADVIDFGIIGDAGRRNKNQENIRLSLLKSTIRKLILPGDNLYSGTYQDVWGKWKDFEFQVVAIGNHTKSYVREIKYFNKKNSKVFSKNKEYYSVGFDSAIFFILNSDNTKTVEEQLNWLESNLKQTKEKYIFIVYHHPTYNITTKHNWQEKNDFQTKMRQILKTYEDRITALLLGHDHIAAIFRFGRVPVIVSGATQESRGEKSVLNSYTDKDDGTFVEQVWNYDGAPHWARLIIDTDADAVSVQMIRATDAKGEATLPKNAPTFNFPNMIKITAAAPLQKSKRMPATKK